MDELPALLPMWHSVTLKSVLGVPQYGNDATLFPDHTGVGIDISFKHGIQECTELKSSTVRSSFAAKCCSLPFLHPNKVKSLRDPCLQTLNNQKKQQAEFCTKLDQLLVNMKRRKDFRNVVNTAHSDVTSLNSLEDCDQISVPQSIVELAETMPEHFPVPRANWRYTNGCLATLSFAEGSSDGLIFHPVGTKMNKLGLTPFMETSSKRKTILACEEKQKTVKLEGGKIYQIEAVKARQRCLCYVRQEKTYHLVNLDVSKENDFSFDFESFSVQQEISSIAVSPFEPGHHSVVTKEGILFIQDANKKKTLWSLDEPLEHDPGVLDMWWGCSFSRAYPGVLCMDRMKLFSYDLRRKKKPIGIFSSVNPFLLNGEQLMTVKHWPGNEYQHLVASDHHLIICDERYPEQPIIQINHMLDDFPVYCDTVSYNGCADPPEYAVLLATQEKQEIASFLIQAPASSVQPLSLGPPLHLSNLGDCAQSLSLQGHVVDERIVKRLSVPLVGVCAIPHSQKQGFTVMQLSSLGDMFYQCFRSCKSQPEKTWKVSPGCALTPPSRILPELSCWMNSALVKEKLPKKTWNTVDKSDTLSRMMERRPRSVRCNICTKKILLEGDEEVDCDVCPSCGLQCDVSQQLMTAMKHGRVIVHSSSDNDSFPALNLVDLSKSTGYLSQKLLSVWEDENFSVPQNKKDLTQTSEVNNMNHTINVNHEKHGELGQSVVNSVGPSVSVDDLIKSPVDRDSSRTPSIDGLDVQRNVDRLNCTNGDDDDIIAPSQDVRHVFGETIRTPNMNTSKKFKIQSSAGF